MRPRHVRLQARAWSSKMPKRERREIITPAGITTNIGTVDSAATATGPGALPALGKTLLSGVAGWLADRSGATRLEINRVDLRNDHSEVWAMELWRHPRYFFVEPVRIRVESCDLCSVLAARLRDFDKFRFVAKYHGRAAIGFPVWRDPDATFRELNDQLIADLTRGAPPPEEGAKIVVHIQGNLLLIAMGRHLAWRTAPKWWLDFRRRIAPWAESRDLSLSGAIRWPSGHRRAEIARMRASSSSPALGTR
jgi:hypothetical protein